MIMIDSCGTVHSVKVNLEQQPPMIDPAYLGLLIVFVSLLHASDHEGLLLVRKARVREQEGGKVSLRDAAILQVIAVEL